jgi:hypothetical protein
MRRAAVFCAKENPPEKLSRFSGGRCNLNEQHAALSNVFYFPAQAKL